MMHGIWGERLFGFHRFYCKLYGHHYAVPPGGLRTAELRGMVPPMYGDREVAEAADSLVAAGLLGSGRRGRWDVLLRE